MHAKKIQKWILSVLMGGIYFVLANNIIFTVSHINAIFRNNIVGFYWVYSGIFLVIGALTAPFIQKVDAKIAAASVVVFSFILYYHLKSTCQEMGCLIVPGAIVTSALAILAMLLGAHLAVRIYRNAKKH